MKASEVAKRFKYTQDYVGQLCRSGKVDARLVGRSWYVELDSVSKYRKNKHATQKTKASEVTSAGSEKLIKINRIKKSVEPVVRSKTLRLAKQGKSFAKQSKDSKVIYESSDEGHVVPINNRFDSQLRTPSQLPKEVTKNKPAKRILVKTQKRKAETVFTSEKLPEVSLSGNVQVTEESQVAQNTVSNTVNKSDSQIGSKKKQPDSSAAKQSQGEALNLGKGTRKVRHSGDDAGSKNVAVVSDDVRSEAKIVSDISSPRLFWFRGWVLPCIAVIVAAIIGLGMVFLVGEVNVGYIGGIQQQTESITF